MWSGGFALVFRDVSFSLVSEEEFVATLIPSLFSVLSKTPNTKTKVKISKIEIDKIEEPIRISAFLERFAATL